MAAYNLGIKEDRLLLRKERQAELDAINSGLWPRDENDRMRWIGYPTGATLKECLVYAAQMCRADLHYLDYLDHQKDKA